MKTIVFATGNQNKVYEIRNLIKNDFNILSLKDINVFEEFEEKGTTFLENSKGKALFYSKFTEYPVIADDSGLEIDFFNKEPGVYSARYIDPQMPYHQRCEIILKKMENVPKTKRTARFKCVASCAFEKKVIQFSEGKVEGEISYQLKGEKGFGYDPIFFYPPFNKTFAEIKIEEKNKISHRHNAFTNLFIKLKGDFNE